MALKGLKTDRDEHGNSSNRKWRQMAANIRNMSAVHWKLGIRDGWVEFIFFN